MVLSTESSRRRRKIPIFAAFLLIPFITIPAATSRRAPRDKRHPMEPSKGVHDPKNEGGHENQSGGESPFLCKPNTHCHAALYRAAEFVVNSTTITVPSLYSFPPFWLSTISVCPGKLLEPNRVWGDKCSEADVSLVQGQTAPMDTGIPTYTVEIVNVCATGCNISGIHLNCAWFSSARLINPKIFKRLRYDDCLVNDGKPLRYGHAVSFQYANTFLYPLSVTAVKC